MAVSAAALSLIAASSAQAATVTVGSPLTTTFGGYYASSPSGTWVNSSLAEPGAMPASPTAGVIVRWRMTGSYSGGPFKLRVLRPTGSGSFTGAGTSAAVTPLGGTQTFTTNLPINAGDLIGVDLTTGSHVSVAGVTGSHVVNWNPALADSSTSVPPYNFNNVELGFNADVEYTPPVTPTQKCKKKKHKHSAQISKKKKCKKKKK
jgi:hypothetical protein